MEEKKSVIDKIVEKRWLPYVIIISIGFVLYFQTFLFGFSYLDDNNLILDNRYFLANLGNLFQSFTIDVFHIFNHSAFYYRPILTISFMFDYQLGGISPFIYHFTNVGLHLLSSCLFFLFLKKLKYREDLSFFFALIFLVHPVLTQAVAWVPGRNDSLLAVFVLSTFILFIQYLEKSKVKYFIWSLIFFAIALFTKESAIFTLPILIFFLIFMYREKSEKIELKKLYYFAWAAGIMIFWFFVRHLVLKDSISVTFPDMIESVFFNFPAVFQFIGKIFFPFNLTVLPIIEDTTFWYGIVSVLILSVLYLFTKKKRWGFVLFGFGWFFAFLLPSFIRPNSAIAADFIEHRLYVPIIGFFIILLETDFINRINFKKKITLYISGALIVLLIVLTFAHSRNFNNRLSFWKDAVKHSPHYPLGHRNLGAMYYLDGDMDKAEVEFKAALAINPNEEMAHNNLGLIYMNRNMLKESEAEYKRELAVNPYYDNAYYNLGILYWSQNKFKEAEDSWKKSLELNPNLVGAMNALAVHYYNQKNYVQAAFYATEIMKRGYQVPQELVNLVRSMML